MSEKVGPINIGGQDARFLSPAFRRGEEVSDETETSIDREVKAILIEGQTRARAVIEERRSDMDVLAELLLEKESLDRSDLQRHFGELDGDGAASTSELPSAESG